MPSAAELLRAYRATRYQVVGTGEDAPVVAQAQVDERSPALDRLLDEHGARSGVFITAWNPRSQPTARARNETAHRRLERELRRRGVRFLAHRGAGADPAWEPEQGLLALDLPLPQALDLAVAFGQNAIVMVEHARPAVLIVTALMPEA